MHTSEWLKLTTLKSRIISSEMGQKKNDEAKEVYNWQLTVFYYPNEVAQ